MLDNRFSYKRKFIFYGLTHSFVIATSRTIIIPILEVREPGLREVK